MVATPATLMRGGGGVLQQSLLVRQQPVFSGCSLIVSRSQSRGLNFLKLWISERCAFACILGASFAPRRISGGEETGSSASRKGPRTAGNVRAYPAPLYKY